MKTRQCNICGNSNSRKLFKKFTYQLVQCEFCKFIYIDPLPNKKQLNDYYKNFNYQTGFINEQIIRHDSIRTLTNLKLFGIKYNSLLDVGCGAGFFMDEARRKGLQVQGIDISGIASNYAQNKLKLKVLNANFLEFDFSNAKFGIISLLQVIEHVADSRKILKKIYGLLEPRGILCIATPNIESYLAKILRKDFNYIIPPEHISYYSPKTLQILLRNANFKVIKTITWGYPTDFASIIKYKFKRKNSADIIKISYSPEGKTVLTKKIKSILFDDIFCKVFYQLLNYNNGGSMVEIYAQK